MVASFKMELSLAHQLSRYVMPSATLWGSKNALAKCWHHVPEQHNLWNHELNKLSLLINYQSQIVHQPWKCTKNTALEGSLWLSDVKPLAQATKVASTIAYDYDSRQKSEELASQVAHPNICIYSQHSLSQDTNMTTRYPERRSTQRWVAVHKHLVCLLLTNQCVCKSYRGVG